MAHAQKRQRGTGVVVRPDTTTTTTLDEIRTVFDDMITMLSIDGEIFPVAHQSVINAIVNICAQVLNNASADDVHDMTLMMLLARPARSSNHMMLSLLLMALVHQDTTTTSTIPNYTACVAKISRFFGMLEEKPRFCSWVQAFAILKNHWDIGRVLQQNMPPLTVEDFQTDFLFTPVDEGVVYTSIFKLFLQYRELGDLHFGFFSYLSTAFAVLTQSDDWNRNSAQFLTQVVDAAAGEQDVQRMLDYLYEELMFAGSLCEKLFVLPARALNLADHAVRAIAIAAAGINTTETSLTNSNLKRYDDAFAYPDGWGCMYTVDDVDQVFSLCDESFDQLDSDALQVLLALYMNVHVPEAFLQAMTTTAMQDVHRFGARVPTLDQDGRETLRSVSQFLAPYTGPLSLSQMLPKKATELRTLLKTLLLVQKRCTLNRDVMHHLAGFF